ncbi:hypothetical protein EJ06DRAFT_527566 [Trichodelitschia bisporula]|uniref:Extracellular membrane protein CFEM domain-containing protein n=1 Tax=Trichodelitschia bisporula TaxID=703511 RepID=A0A6G1I786_9PEZI|nr:hypothetical protein EJ06DRAFT_527566 [Trichodelitschia bisporula]
MKFTLSLSLSFLFTLAAAQTTTTTALSPTQSCLNKCPAGDVNCQAICVGVPHPGDAQMNATTDCVAKCDQGDGTAEATNRYSECRDRCISSYIITSGTAAPGGVYSTAGKPVASSDASATGSGAAASGTGAGAAGSGASASASGAKASGTASSSSGANMVESAGGFLGLFVAALALL